MPMMTRREALRNAGSGFGMLGLAHLLAQEGAAGPVSHSPAPHFAPKAKRVIFLFLNGGPSQVDTFDPKPALDKYHGQPMPSAEGSGATADAVKERGTLMRSPFTFKQ